MTEMEFLRSRLDVAERRIRLLSIASLLIVVVALIAATAPQDDVIRARGLVIIDSDGRDRLVLGAPIGDVSSDEKLRDAIGLVVLDSMARLHVAIGANRPLVVPGGGSGMRAGGLSAGLTVYDPLDGRERGGFGVYSDGRANICLDYRERQKEAACMSVAPGDQYAAFLLNGTPNEDVFDRAAMYVGADGRGSIKVFGGGANRGGVMIRAGEGAATITTYDSTGTAIRDVAKEP